MGVACLLVHRLYFHNNSKNYVDLGGVPLATTKKTFIGETLFPHLFSPEP